MIELEDYTFGFEGSVIFDGIELQIPSGTKTVLLGSNGSGKSTLLRILAGLYFGKGVYRLGGTEVTKKSIKNLRSTIGILFQNPDSMIFNPTVYDEIAFSPKIFGTEREDLVVQIAKDFGISHLLDKSPLKLSGGEKQKVMLASILSYEPKYLLLDEPTSAMDPKTTGWLIDFLLELDITILTATHDISFAYESSDDVVVLDGSHRFIYQGDMETLMKDLDTLQEANLIHKHKHKHKSFSHSHYHLH